MTDDTPASLPDAVLLAHVAGCGDVFRGDAAVMVLSPRDEARLARLGFRPADVSLRRRYTPTERVLEILHHGFGGFPPCRAGLERASAAYPGYPPGWWHGPREAVWARMLPSREGKGR